ncbi:hypothetical protein DL96DRAFT_1013259 [Flagelloscypha sp. PMI_526]|nr:hypothetical protein DL96DRAFT_1013259 [Flagelloscypha sp. PMI_526]
MNLNDDATFRFAKFKLDGSYSSLKRKRPLTPDLENAKQRTKSAAAVPPQQFQSPIKNEHILVNPRSQRPSNVERAENDHAAALQAQSPPMQHQQSCALQNPVTPSSNAPLIHKRPHSASLQMEKSLGIRPFRKDIQVPQGSCPHIPQKDVPHWSQTSDKRPRRQRKELFV